MPESQQFSADVTGKNATVRVFSTGACTLLTATGGAASAQIYLHGSMVRDLIEQLQACEAWQQKVAEVAA